MDWVSIVDFFYYANILKEKKVKLHAQMGSLNIMEACSKWEMIDRSTTYKHLGMNKTFDD